MIQPGTTDLPIIVKPRINGVITTISDLKNNQSSAFISDIETPVNFILEYRAVNQEVPNLVAFDPALTTDNFLVFLPPDSLYANKEEWTVNVFWTIAGEKRYTLNSYHLSVKDSHDV